MEVSNQLGRKKKKNAKRKEPGGDELISAVVSATGLPAPVMQKELESILGSSGHNSAELTLDELRAAMVAYLEVVGKDLFTDESGQHSPEPVAVE